MCAIAGEIRFDGNSPDLSALWSMTALQQARGPGWIQVSVSPGNAFGHRRLKIMDLSDAAQQPMVDPAAWPGYRLQRCGIQPPGAAQGTRGAGLRVLLCMATPKCCSRPITPGVRISCSASTAACSPSRSGERDSGRVLLGRDRLGIAALLRGTWRRPALRLDPAGPARRWRCRHLDRSAGAQSLPLSSGTVVPAPHTLFAGVRKLAPGSLMTIEADGRRSERRFWSLDYSRDAADEAQLRRMARDPPRCTARRGQAPLAADASWRTAFGGSI